VEGETEILKIKKKTADNGRDWWGGRSSIVAWLLQPPGDTNYFLKKRTEEASEFLPKQMRLDTC